MGMSQMSVQQSTQPGGKGGFSAPQQQNSQQGQLLADIQAQVGQQQVNPTNLASMQQNSLSPAPSYSNSGSPIGGNQTSQPMQNRMGGKGGRTTNAATSGQPQMGQPNNYPNTVGQWDNASIQSQQPLNRGGKGKG
jgi:hypothetical protein